MSWLRLLNDILLRGFWRLVSVPFLFKVMGIVVLVALVLGSYSLYQVSGAMSRLRTNLVVKSAVGTSVIVSQNLERSTIAGDKVKVENILLRVKQSFPEIRYAVVCDREGSAIAHTFRNGLPPDLSALFQQETFPDGDMKLLKTQDDFIVDVTQSIADGYGNSLHLGFSDQALTSEMSSATWSVLAGIPATIGFGGCLALLLGLMVTRPIGNLVDASRRIRGGDFNARVRVASGDEIGRVSAAFNEMASSIQDYRSQHEMDKVRLQSMMDRLVQAQEEERKKISRELHDEIGQSVIGLLMTTEPDCEFSAQPGSRCGEMKVRLKHLADEVQKVARGTRPSILDDYGLDATLARAAEEYSKDGSTSIDYQSYGWDKDTRLPDKIESALYRVAQEGLTNILRHAEAEHASLILRKQPEMVTLLIEDDGLGFDPVIEAERDTPGLGLTGMSDRVVLLGGDFRIESAPGKGAIVRVTVPIIEE